MFLQLYSRNKIDQLLRLLGRMNYIEMIIALSNLMENDTLCDIYAVHSVGVPLEKSCVLTRGAICSRAGQFSVTARDSCRNIMK